MLKTLGLETTSIPILQIRKLDVWCLSNRAQYRAANKDPEFGLRLRVTLLPNTVLGDLPALISLDPQSEWSPGVFFYSHFTEKENKEQELLASGQGQTQPAGRQEVTLASALSWRAQVEANLH